jgi:hypothetical protein
MPAAYTIPLQALSANSSIGNVRYLCKLNTDGANTTVITSVSISTRLEPKTSDDEWILMKVDTTVTSVETTTKLALLKLLQLEITTDGNTNFCGGNDISAISEIS